MPTRRTLPTASLNPADLAGLRVLVVDDNQNMLRLVSDVLRAGGVGEVFMADDGHKALKSLALRQPHVIFTDWRMPNMDGLAFTQAVRQAAVTPNPLVPDPRVPIVMLTAQRREFEVENARRAGVNEFVVKPFTPAAILSRIQLVLTKPRDFIVSETYVGPDRRRRTELNYTGPLRRGGDPDEIADSVEREVTRQTIGVELDAMRRLIRDRGAIDAATMKMTYRVMKHTEHRARALRDQMIVRASAAFSRYVEAMGGPAHCDPAMVEVHLDALSTLLGIPDTDAESAALVAQHLERAVERKIGQRARAA